MSYTHCPQCYPQFTMCLNIKSVLLSVRAPGIEPESRPWQGRVLPLNHARNIEHYILNLFFSNFPSAPGRTRTYKNGSEDRCDIHFTTGAYFKHL